MAYQFSDLKTKLKNRVGDPNLDDDLAGDAINDTQQEIFNMFDLQLNSDTQTNALASGANTLTSALPSDFQRVLSLYISSPTAKAGDVTRYYMNTKEFREMYPDSGTYTSTPQYWTYYGDTLEFAHQADDDYVINLDYVKSVPYLSATTDVPVIPESFQELLLVGAMIRIFEQKEDFDYAGQYVNRYADLQEAFITRYGMHQVDNQVTMRQPRRGRVSWR